METLGDWITAAPWKSRAVALIGIAPDGGWTQALAIGEKRALLTAETKMLSAVWAGEWKVTAREFGPGDREKVRERIG